MLTETKSANGYYLDNPETGENVFSAWRQEGETWGVDYGQRYYELTADELETMAQIVKNATNRMMKGGTE